MYKWKNNLIVYVFVNINDEIGISSYNYKSVASYLNINTIISTWPSSFHTIKYPVVI